jgi:CheY-like chemotaxis protein
MVVDDQPDHRYTLTHALKGAGFDVRETASGRDALRLCRDVKPEVIVLDIKLPDIDGFEIVRRLKADSATAGIPVIHKTAVYRDPAHREKSLAAGADDYLSEPFEPGDLVAAVRRLLEERS